MLELVLSLTPLAVGIIVSPLAIMALVATLLSQRGPVNGAAFAAGWSLAVFVLLAGWLGIFAALGVEPRTDPPGWAAPVRILFAGMLLLVAGYVARSGRKHSAAMARADTIGQVTAAAAGQASSVAPRLPRWMAAVEHFTPFRSALLGAAVFAFNPVDASCAAVAALDMLIADVSPLQQALSLLVFGVICCLPVAIPAVVVLRRRERARPLLNRLRAWIAAHTSLLNALVLIVIAALQLQKAVSILIA